MNIPDLTMQRAAGKTPIPFLTWFWRKWTGSLRLRLTVGLSGVILFIMGMGSGLMIYKQATITQEAVEARVLTLSRTFALMGGAAVHDNLFRIQEAMNQYFQDPDIVDIDLIDPDHMIMAAKHPERIGLVLRNPVWLAAANSQTETTTYIQAADGERMLVIVEPLRDRDEIVAWVRIVFSLASMHQDLLLAVGRMIAVTLALMVAGVIAVGIAFRQMSNVFHGTVAQLQTTLRMFGRFTNSGSPRSTDGCPYYSNGRSRRG